MNSALRLAMLMPACDSSIHHQNKQCALMYITGIFQNTLKAYLYNIRTQGGYLQTSEKNRSTIYAKAVHVHGFCCKVLRL